jgi:hypothetical protein
LFVQEMQSDGSVGSSEYLGPLFFQKNIPGQAQQKGFRPFYLETRNGDLETHTFLYPFFSWRKQADFSSFSFFQLVNTSLRTDSGQPAARSFDLWPFYFSRETGHPEDSYRAFFPAGGTIKARFGKDRIHFVAFPFYSRVEKAGLRTTHAPWPFLRFIDGAGHHGFEFWPLFGHRGRDGDYDDQFYLWPFFYKTAHDLSAPQPTESFGALPFYTRDTGPGFISETYAWPFFGYTHRTEPYHYDEQRYLWPLFVQARGDQRYINRWAPFYTHSVIKGTAKTWAPWPLWRNERWQAEGVAQEKSQLLFFLYWSLEQRSLTNPAAPPAHKTHLWPLFSSWDNGAGRKQLQVLSPLEIFFPHNDTVRQLYTPLFALYRHDRKSAVESRWSLLWSAVSYRRDPDAREFHLGPIFSVNTTSTAGRVALGAGLIGLRHRPGERGWRLFLFDFHSKKDNKATAALPP